MSLTQKRKGQFLVFLIALFALSISANYIPNRIPPVIASAPSGAVHIDTAPDELPSLDPLNREPPLFNHVERNIFQFDQGDSAVQSGNQTIPETEEIPETASAQPQAPQVKYLGFYREMGPAGEPMASILVGDRIYVGKTGDVLAQSFKLLKVSRDSIEIQMLADGRTFRIPLGNNETPVQEN